MKGPTYKFEKRFVLFLLHVLDAMRFSQHYSFSSTVILTPLRQIFTT
jgi:hypothetical protein